MNRGASTYQLEDVQTVIGWLGNPERGIAANSAITTAIATVTTGWLGFYPALELIDTSTYQPQAAPVPPATVGVAANPKAAAGWRMNYGADVSQPPSRGGRLALGGGLLEGLPAILYLTLLVQPYVDIQTPYRLAEKIRGSIAALAAAANMPPNPSAPIAQGPNVGKWSSWPIIVRFWSTTPA